MPHQDDQRAFSLVELLVVVVIIGILAAIGIPRFLSQRDVARDGTVVSDLRNLVAVEVGLEAAGGLSADRDRLAEEGWRVSDPGVTVCAELVASNDLVLTAWHEAGTKVFTYRRSAGGIDSVAVPLPDGCDEATGGGGVEVS